MDGRAAASGQENQCVIPGGFRVRLPCPCQQAIGFLNAPESSLPARERATAVTCVVSLHKRTSRAHHRGSSPVTGPAGGRFRRRTAGDTQAGPLPAAPRWTALGLGGRWGAGTPGGEPRPRGGRRGALGLRGSGCSRPERGERPPGRLVLVLGERELQGAGPPASPLRTPASRLCPVRANLSAELRAGR